MSATVTAPFRKTSNSSEVIGLIVALPYGVLADKLGRKPIIYLSTSGFMLYLTYVLAILKFPNHLAIEYILLGPLLTIIGGGSTVINASLYSLASDLVPDTNITISYSVMAFGGLFGSSAGPAIASKLMKKYSPWFPIFVGYLTIPIGTTLLVLVPEIVTSRNNSVRRNTSELNDSSPGMLYSWLFESWVSFKTSIRRLGTRPSVLILVTYLKVNPERLAYGQLLVQYVSKRFDWTFADAGYLLTARGFTQIFILLGLLPVLSKLLSKKLRPAAMDLLLARASACMAILGSLFTGAPQIGLVVFGLILQASGAGLTVICRSLAMRYITPRDKSKMNAMIGITETIGSLFQPTLALLFTLGMKFRMIWFGLPYFGLSAWCILCLLGLLFVGSSQDQEYTNVHDDQSSTESIHSE